jgi:hypothetical protein
MEIQWKYIDILTITMIFFAIIHLLNKYNHNKNDYIQNFYLTPHIQQCPIKNIITQKNPHGYLKGEIGLYGYMIQ